MKPVRLQLSRRKGFKLTSPNGLPVVVVSRPSKWGNPFKVGGFAGHQRKRSVRLWRVGDKAAAVRWFKRMLRDGKTPPFNLADIRCELRGRNLACWCKLTEKCHADTLLEIANS